MAGPATAAMTNVARSSLDNPEANALMEQAKALAAAFACSSLSIASAESNFEQKITAFNEFDPVTPFTQRQTPQQIASDVAAQISFLRKLKFGYLEQYAKDKFIKTIVSDDASIVTVDDNEQLRRSNEVKKANLKSAKELLGDRNKEFCELASEVEDKYKLAESLTDEFNRLTSEILDARHSLVRLRASHPQATRVSAASASAMLESQTAQITGFDDLLLNNAERSEKLKERMQETAREIERLRLERAAKEEQARQTKQEEEDVRVSGMYEWFDMSIVLHRMLFSLVSSKALAENELQLTYAISLPSSSETKTSGTSNLSITLLFRPNTRLLATASIVSPDPVLTDLKITDLIGSHVQSNDAPGLVRAILARARNAMQSRPSS